MSGHTLTALVCLCGHVEDDHPEGGQCVEPVKGAPCGCMRFRDAVAAVTLPLFFSADGCYVDVTAGADSVTGGQ